MFSGDGGADPKKVRGGVAAGSFGDQTGGSTGGGSSHTHSVSGSATGTSTALNLNVRYADAIIAAKD